jgi:hypothetical protein
MAVATTIASCGGGDSSERPVGSDDPPAATDDGIAGAEQPGGRSAPMFPGFDLVLQDGGWWEFARHRASTSFAQGSGGSSSSSTGRFLVQLGARTDVAGVTVHPVTVTALEGDPPGEITRWRYLGMAEGVVVGSTDGTTVAPVFDPRGDVQAGGGFFVEFASDELTAARTASARFPSDVLEALPPSPYIDIEAVELTDSFSEGRCEYFPDVGNICTGERDQTLTIREYLLPGVGPLGLSRQSSFSDCGGGFCSGSTDTRAIVLLDHSLDASRPAPTPVTTTSTTEAPPPARPDDTAEYVSVTDDTASMRADVPAAWVQVRTGQVIAADGTIWPTIVAAPDLAGFEGSYDGPGLMIQIGPEGLLIDDLTTWFDDLTAGDVAMCTLAARESSPGLETLTLTDCGGQRTVLSWVGGHFAQRTYWWVVQAVDERDAAHLERFLDSLSICEVAGCPLG